MNEILERLRSLVETVVRQVESHGELNRRFGEEVLPRRVGDLLDEGWTPMDGVRTAEGGEGATGEMAWAPLG